MAHHLCNSLKDNNVHHQHTDMHTGVKYTMMSLFECDRAAETKPAQHDDVLWIWDIVQVTFSVLLRAIF